MKMIAAIVDAVENLPPVPNVINELQNLYYMDTYNAHDIENIIKKDPALVANILKIANSPIYEFAREIVDIRQAIVLFGLDKIIEFALASYMNELLTFDLELYHISTEDFLRLSQRKSVIAAQLIENKKDKFLVSNTAFLADIAKIIIANYAKKENIELQFDENISLNELDEIEKSQFGFDTIEITTYIFDKWNFEKNMVDLMKNFKKQENLHQKAIFIARDIINIKAKLLEENREKYEETSKIHL